jgi:thymidylate kinase
MRLIIFEGTDRCGKDSHIAELTKNLRNYTVRHWSFPQGNTDIEKKIWQQRTFHQDFSLYLTLKAGFPDHALIWNRAHLGELVYGKIYRNSDPDTWVPELENIYALNRDENVFLVHLTVDPEFAVQEDDGNSYSDKLEKKAAEIEAFQKAVDESKIINKITIKVNDGKQYRDFHELSQQIRSFVGI